MLPLPWAIGDALDTMQLFGLGRALKVYFGLGSDVMARRGIEFYPSRTAMVRHRLGLSGELKKVERMWVGFESGAFYNSLGNQYLDRIQRMLLLDPGSEFCQHFAGMYGDEPFGTFVSNIRSATNRAQNNGTEVRWSSQPILNAVIGNPLSDKPWARIQTYIPYLKADCWPNIVVWGHKQRELFDVIRESYEKLWDTAMVAPKQSGD